jgi:dihydroorotate dehydrogenase
VDSSKLLRTILFDRLGVQPEWARNRLINYCAALDRRCNHPDIAIVLNILKNRRSFYDSRLETSLWGLQFANPVGLAAGLDKDGVATNVWPFLGFGYAEIGTVTQHAQPGNPRPRLFRLPEDLAAINRMGFNNQGAEQMAAHLAASQERQTRTYTLGINLGKSKITPLEQAVDDYVGSFRLLRTYGDYFVVNVSSPNTPGLRSLQAVEQLEPILEGLQSENIKSNIKSKPLLVKISPDLEWEEIAAIADLAQKHHLAGIIATNTTTQRQGLKTTKIKRTGQSPEGEAGGLSGAPLKSRSTEVIHSIWKHTHGQLPIIGVGGIFTADDAWEKITAGASLLQVYTGWFYQGPPMVRDILEGLMHKLDRVGAEKLSEVVGQIHYKDNENSKTSSQQALTSSRSSSLGSFN